MTRSLGRTLLAAGGLLAGTVAGVSGASAQSSDWLWGGGTTMGGSGKATVRFTSQYSPGQVVVSFGDRRLYLSLARVRR